MALHEQFEALPAARRATFVERALDDPVTRAAITPSAVQERMIVMSSWSGGAAAYNLSTATRFHGPLDVAALHEAYRRLQLRHEQLTRRFVHHDGTLLALPGEPQEARPVLDVAVPAEARPDDARRRARAAATTPFEVIGAPLTRLQVVRYGATDHLVLLDVHHAVADGRSLEIVDRDLARCYDDARRRIETVWPAPAGRYADYVLGEQAEQDRRTEQALGRVLDRLAGAPTLLDLPTDQPRPSTQDFAGATVVRELDPRTSAALLRLAGTARTTLFSVGLALFADAIRHTSGQDDLVVGVPVLGRPSLELDDVVGMFVNTVPVRLDLTGTTAPRAVGRRVHDAWVAAVEDQLVPLDAVVDAVGAERDASRPPVFQVTFALSEDTGERATWPDLVAEPVEVDGGSAKFDLALTLLRRGDRLRLELEHATSVVDHASAERVLDLVELLADAATAHPDDDVRARFRQLPGALPQTPAWDAERVDVELPDADAMWDLVRAAARRLPATVAVRTATTSLTYDELVGRAGVLARRLHAEGVAPGSRVGVMLARSEELVPALLAVWAHGSSYVPLDPTYPTERLAFMLRDAGCRALLVDDSVPKTLGEVCEPIDVRTSAGTTADDLPVTAVTADHEAYLLYTSGSTGTPKGVSIPHRAVLAMVRGTLHVFGTAPLRRSLAATSISFDVSTVELYPTLATGGTVHLVDSLLDGPREVPASTFTAGVPTLLSAALDIGSLEVSGMVVAAGGEPLPRTLVERLTAAGAQRVVNIYGPSEDCTYSTAAVVAADEAPPIGWAVPGGRAYVLDRDGYVVPPGAVGEVHLAGAGLADGYASRPRLTAERFVPDPVGEVPGARCYRTGDLARLRPDGALVYLGRSDRQVKVNGLRIELGEVEAALLGSPGVTSAVALVQRDARSARLAAAVTGDADLDPRALRRDLARRLPRALVPAVVVPVDALPRLANGKTDVTAVRDLLPAFGTSARTTPQAAPPAAADVTQREDDDAERLVRECWTELLGASHGGDFFAEGGTSLTALRLALRLTDRAGTRVTLADVFAARTVEALAAHVRARPARPVGPAIRSVGAEDPVVLSPAQQSLWWVEAAQDVGAAYVIPLAWQLEGLLDEPALAAAVEALQWRHPLLRHRIDPTAMPPATRPGPPTPAATGRAARPQRPGRAVPVLRGRAPRRARRAAALRRRAVATRRQKQRARTEGPPPRRRRLVPRRRGRGPRRALRPVPRRRRRGAR
ncbi:MAG: amino acid adenylation domain-containing protein [Aeromicrobium erythreum]